MGLFPYAAFTLHHTLVIQRCVAVCTYTAIAEIVLVLSVNLCTLKGHSRSHSEFNLM